MAKDKRKRERGPLDGSPSHLMHRVLQYALDIYAEETGPGALTQRQFAVLAAVAEDEGLSQTDLVRATGIDRSTLADLVARMIGKGLLERERSSLDGRANTVRLAERGREALEAARPRVEAADKRILSLAPRGKRESFLKLLAAFAAAGEAEKAALAEKAARKAEKARRKAEKAVAEPKPGRRARKAPRAAATGEGAGPVEEKAPKKARRA
ncbi:MAG TPA: MarR family transcriptional regulator [Caulobacteraceae bacterium]|nr:MarR family transcriptional regulator [Caulobacteraceae bacterium]